MVTRSYTDWRSWLAGIWDSTIPVGATALSTSITTNGLDAMGVTHGLGMNWKQTLAQAGIHMLLAFLKYMNSKPRPSTVVETFETAVEHRPEGDVTVEKSKTEVTKEVEEKK